MKRNYIATVVSAALLGMGSGAALIALESSLPRAAYAQDDHGSGGHESGGHESGGHESGKGKGKGGGHDSGGHESGEESSGQHRWHGTRPGHEGHASGQHGAAGEGDHASSAHGANPRRFGGGSGLSSDDAVPEGPGQFGRSAGPGPQNQLRYWGGWTIPEEPVPPPTVVVVEDVPLSSGGGGGGGLGLNLSYTERCEGIGGAIAPTERISGRNLARINAVHGRLVAPDTRPEAVAPFLLANFQEELEKPNPDYGLAGVYLGTLADEPVTPQVVAETASALCVIVDAGQAELIAAAAEAQRSEKSTTRVTRSQLAAMGATGAVSGAAFAASAPDAEAPPLLAAVASPAAAAPVQTVTIGVLFPFDSAEPHASGRRELDELAEALKDAEIEAVVAVGHADRIGPPSYNEQLSERRAAAVRSYLAARGIADDKVSVAGRGESEPVTGDACRNLRGAALVECLQPDRRVQIEVRAVTGRPQ